jgi:hypothetical protein
VIKIRTGAIGLLRTELYVLMYEVAKEHRDLAKKISGKARNEEIKESMISILFSFTCLEAYINAIGRDRLVGEWMKYEGNSIEAKWMGVSKWLATKKHGTQTSVFHDHKNPFMAFLELKKIREDYLVHWKPTFSRGVKTKYGTGAEAVSILNCEKAEWACNIVRDIVIKLNANMDNPLSAAWLD